MIQRSLKNCEHPNVWLININVMKACKIGKSVLTKHQQQSSFFYVKLFVMINVLFFHLLKFMYKAPSNNSCMVEITLKKVLFRLM